MFQPVSDVSRACQEEDELEEVVRGLELTHELLSQPLTGGCIGSDIGEYYSSC